MFGAYDRVIMAVDKNDFAHPDRLNDVMATIELLSKGDKGSDHMLTFHGYDNDPREVYQIAECRALCQRVLLECPAFYRVADEVTQLVLLFSTAIKVDGKWVINPAWASMVPNYRDLELTQW